MGDTVRGLEHLEVTADIELIERDIEETGGRAGGDCERVFTVERSQDIEKPGHRAELGKHLLLHDAVAYFEQFLRRDRKPQFLDKDFYRFERTPPHHLPESGFRDGFTVVGRDLALDLEIEPFAIDHQSVHIENNSARF